METTTGLIGVGRGRGRGVVRSSPANQNIHSNKTHIRVISSWTSGVVAPERSDEGASISIPAHIEAANLKSLPQSIRNCNKSESKKSKCSKKVISNLSTRSLSTAKPKSSSTRRVPRTDIRIPFLGVEIPTKLEQRQLEGPAQLSNFLPKFYKPSNPSKRLNRIRTCELKILKVLDNEGNLMVAFQDEDSVVRFGKLLQQMGRFYRTPEGFAMKKPGKSLESGEVVAATVFAGEESPPKFRRVQVQFTQGHEKSFRAHAVDIDSLVRWNIRNAFSLPYLFYKHPSQACPFRILNFDDWYPRGLFDQLFSNRITFHRVMKTLAQRILTSIIGHGIAVTEIKMITENEKQIFTGKVHRGANLRLETLYMEAFCNYYTPIIPEEGKMYEGVITDVLAGGLIGICMKGSLYHQINELLNGVDMHKMASSVTEKGRQKLLERIRTQNCRVCIAYDAEKSRLLRVKIRSFSDTQTGRDTILKLEDLICGMTNNPNIPPVLALLPPQGHRLKLAGDIYNLSKQQCDDIFYKYGSGIKFRTCKSKTYSCILTEVELYHKLASDTESLNSILKQSK